MLNPLSLILSTNIDLTIGRYMRPYSFKIEGKKDKTYLLTPEQVNKVEKDLKHLFSKDVQPLITKFPNHFEIRIRDKIGHIYFEKVDLE